MKVVVKINPDAYPELAAELAAIPDGTSGARASRLRFLANFGAIVLRMGALPAGGVPAPAERATPAAAEEERPRAARIARSARKSLAGGFERFGRN